MQIVESVKNHPYLFGSVAIGAIIVIVVVRHASNNAGAVEVSAGPSGSVDTGTALQVASMQASSQANQLQAQIQDDQIKANATLALADLQGKYSTNLATINSNVELSKISATADVAKMQSTLGAQIQGQQISANRDIQLGSFANSENLANINKSLQTTIAKQLSDTTIASQQISAGTVMAQISNSYALEQQKIAANAELARVHEADTYTLLAAGGSPYMTGSTSIASAVQFNSYAGPSGIGARV